MNRLFKLKKWLTVPEAARHLSIVFGEEVNESDVLRLALDGHLKLSVNFVNHANARPGKTVPLSEAKTVSGIPLKHGKPSDSNELILGLRIAINHPDGQVEEKVVQFDEKIVSIDGVWDLSMFGGERLDVEHKFQMLTNGVEVTLVNIDGTYVRDLDGEIWDLQSSYDENEYQRGSVAHLRKLEEQIALENIEPSKARELLDQHKEERKKYLAERKAATDAGRDSVNYYPAGGLPSDSVLVVRTEALREFEESINEAPPSAGKPLATTERNTLLTIIAALCDYSAIKPQERGAAAQIAKLTEEIGATVTDDTVRKALAKIPDALGTRMK